MKDQEFPSKAFPLAQHPASLPEVDVPEGVDIANVAGSSLEKLKDLSSSDLTENAIWRDLFALTGTLRTFFKPDSIAKIWQELSHNHRPTNLAIQSDSTRLVRLGPKTSWVQSSFTFDIIGQRPARCSGVVGLVPDETSEWKIWLLSTILEQPHGYPDVDMIPPVRDDEQSQHTKPLEGQTYDCLVVGGSIGGLCMAARLRALNLSYAVVEKHANVGDSWRMDRYDSLKLHTSRAYNQMPGEPRTFGPDCSYHLDMSELVEGFQKFVKTFGIQVLLSTALISGSWDSTTRCWTLKLLKRGVEFVVKARHVVLGVGNQGVTPKMPQYPHRDQFKGDIVHGLNWRNALPWKGKRGAVIGSANTAHGVVSDMADASFTAITMIQRSRTFLLPESTFSALVDPFYNDDIATTDSDRMMFAYPLPITRLMGKAAIRMCANANAAYFDSMEAKGWEIERNGDLWGMMYDREGGHFFDIGSGELIRNGTVTVRCDALPVAYTEGGLEMSDGSHIDADVIVFATGYTGNIRDTAYQLFGESVNQSLEEFWQCDDEGESRGAWKYVGHPGLWYTGHGFAHARYYSRFVAMHIKADIDGDPIEMYTKKSS